MPAEVIFVWVIVGAFGIGCWVHIVTMKGDGFAVDHPALWPDYEIRPAFVRGIPGSFRVELQYVHPQLASSAKRVVALVSPLVHMVTLRPTEVGRIALRAADVVFSRTGISQAYKRVNYWLTGE